MATSLVITNGEVNDISVSVNNTNVAVTQGSNLIVEVTPVPRQTIVIDRSVAGPPGPPGPPGSSDIGGYPVNILSPSDYDALMFLDNEWTNIPQTEITDGGNF